MIEGARPGFSPENQPKLFNTDRIIGGEEDYKDLGDPKRLEELEGLERADWGPEEIRRAIPKSELDIPKITDNDPLEDKNEDVKELVGARIAQGSPANTSRSTRRPSPRKKRAA